MKFTKRRLAAAAQGYSITSMRLLGTECVVAASEGPGPGVAFPEPDLAQAVIAEGPGGCMGFAPVPGRDDALLMITRFYPIFKGEDAGVHLYTAEDGFRRAWRGRRVLDLPYLHRIATVEIGGRPHLVAATVCSAKAFQDDWSLPGAVYVAPFPDDLDGTWKTSVVLPEIHRNHGLNVGMAGGRKTLFVSGVEGIFALPVPRTTGEAWSSERIIDHDVSEVFPCDLDGDGVDELAVIEPFHGQSMAVYKRSGAGWKRVFSAKLGFGHGLWAGTLAGERVVLVGNRAGTKNLCCYRTRSTSPFDMEEIVVDAGSGTTNVAVISAKGSQSVVSSNPEHGEYAIYAVSA